MVLMFLPQLAVLAAAITFVVMLYCPRTRRPLAMTCGGTAITAFGAGAGLILLALLTSLPAGDCGIGLGLVVGAVGYLTLAVSGGCGLVSLAACCMLWKPKRRFGPGVVIEELEQSESPVQNRVNSKVEIEVDP